MTDLIQIPPAFIQDHRERDLPTPRVVKATKAKLFIAASDPALAELLDDARHYASFRASDGLVSLGLISSAKATVRAIEAHKAAAA